MEPAPWTPFEDLTSWREEMGKFFTKVLAEPRAPGALAVFWLPAIEISETMDKVIVRAELPGLEAKDVAVSMSGDLLTIKGEKKQEEEEKDEHFHYAERYYGSFQRSARLPVSVEVDKVEATFNRGILKITLPKVAGAEKMEIRVEDE